jgi:mutator protein MutT
MVMMMMMMMMSEHVRVGVIVRRGGKILMAKRAGSHGAGSWSFPGGHVEMGEDPTQTAARELQETDSTSPSISRPLSMRIGSRG